MPLLASGDLAKELIRRRHITAREQVVNTTSSYEMVEDEGLEHATQMKNYGRRFWRRKSRVEVEDSDDGVQGAQTGWFGGSGNRIVSEPVVPSLKDKMLGRFRFRRASENIPFMEEDSMEMTVGTDITGTDQSNGDTTLDESMNEPVNASSKTYDHSEAGPSFISFSPAVSSVRYIHRTPPSKRTLALTLADCDRPANRDEAVRAVTLEARLAQHSISEEPDTSSSLQTPEYPSLAYTDPDSGSDIKGILRARNNRAPPNTPSPTVRFVDPWLTPIGSLANQPQLKVRDTEDSLPAAQISGGPRWKRLGAILGAIDHHQPEESNTINIDSHDGIDPLDISTTDTAVTTSCSSDSPICFARFDTGDLISSTPLRKPRRPASQSIFFPTHSTYVAAHFASPFDHTARSPSSPPSPSPSPLLSPDSVWSTRSADDDAVVENCSALEALWEYGSEGSNEPNNEDEDEYHSSPEVRIGMIPSAPISPTTPNNPTPSDPAVIVCGSSGSTGMEIRRGSGELLPLKYTGRVARTIEEDPFPFATTLRYQV